MVPAQHDPGSDAHIEVVKHGGDLMAFPRLAIEDSLSSDRHCC